MVEESIAPYGDIATIGEAAVSEAGKIEELVSAKGKFNLSIHC
jgi:hypothetical protein